MNAGMSRSGAESLVQTTINLGILNTPSSPSVSVSSSTFSPGVLASYGSNSLIPMPSPQPKFNVGDRVVLISGYEGNGNNPHWGKDGQYVVGTVTHVNVSDCNVAWDNSKSNGYTYGECVLKLESEMKKPAPPQVKIDEKKLDALVIDQSDKDDILAVLRQHKYAAKMFDTWGLSEVIEYGRGMTFMFHGGPGTGKTWAAHCIAKALGTKLHVVSAAEIQSQEPGAANRNIQSAFAKAHKEKLVLFLDECDSLIANRQELGMVLASEVNTLLTEIEKSEGVVILATNMVEHMDAALERRLSLILEFKNPTEAMRCDIWAKLIPKKMPLTTEVVITELAKHALTGGQIKNVVLQAARLALSQNQKRVSMANFQAAITRLKASQGKMGSRPRNMAHHVHTEVHTHEHVDTDVSSFLNSYKNKDDETDSN